MAFQTNRYEVLENLNAHSSPSRIVSSMHQVMDTGSTTCTRTCFVKIWMTGFSHCTKMVPVKSHNDFSRPLVEKGVV